MDLDVSLSWHGPLWHAGLDPAAGQLTAFGIPGASPLLADILPSADLAASLAGDTESASSFPALSGGPLPTAILLAGAFLDTPVGARLAPALRNMVTGLSAEVPLVLLGEPVTEKGFDLCLRSLRPTAIVDATAPADVLFALVCNLQRSLLRSEEARIRRKVFGRQAGYGVSPRLTGQSGLLVIGVSGRFLELQAAGPRAGQVVGAFNQTIGEDFLEHRAFDAVVIDQPFGEALESLHRLRMDSRFSALPVLVLAETAADAALLLRAGATDVVCPPILPQSLGHRLSVAIRQGKRRRLADRVLAETHYHVLRQMRGGGLSVDRFETYLALTAEALARRGLKPYQLRMDARSFGAASGNLTLAADLEETLLSIALATSREEDLVCLVEGQGPVAVVKSARGLERLKSRIGAILGTTRL
ncbi:hypothetical protein [Roseibium aestuarii]|uniref:Response regulatory domain-containing protein n=1 Tax=Roseibium aestuarii TaxID=2600299 RepID=A0ABW4JRZ5_9HYPH|nr:hypothetical protein [Roseibium aestuarii]